MKRVVVALGSNLGNRLGMLQHAVDSLSMDARIEVIAASSIYETDPIGPSDQPYLNAALVLRTDYLPHELLEVCQDIERESGRVRTVKWGPRTLDLDIIWFDTYTMVGPSLTIPHPHAHERLFVLVPLAELDLELAHDLASVPIPPPAELPDSIQITMLQLEGVPG